MSLSNYTEQKLCCTEHNPIYEITYSDSDEIKTVNVCAVCFEKNILHDKFGKIFLWKEHVKQILCLSCNSIVTESMGCNDCHPKSEESS